MGFNLSRPQYGYRERRHPADYFRVCDPSNCFCGGPTHFRQRNVAVHRTAGGMEHFQDPMDMMDGLLGGYGMPGMPGMMGMGGYGMPSMGAYAMPTALGYGMPPLIGGMGMVPAMNSTPVLSGMPTYGSANNPGSTNLGWPPEWKDPREWTTRDYDRLGEVVDEYLNRQRGRGMPGSFGQQMSPYAQQPSPFGPAAPMENSWDNYGRRPHRSRPSHNDLDQLRAQMFTYAQEAKEHMQSVNDFLYGSEREQREERYKERQRKMIEDILRSLTGANRNNEPTVLGAQSPQSALPGAAYHGMHPMMGMPPGAGFMGAGNPMAGMQPMFPGGMEGMNPYAGMEGFPQRPRQRRSPRGLGYGDGYDGQQGGFGDDFGSRRGGRRQRRGFDEGDDDFMDPGDGRRTPKGPPGGPRQPLPDRGGAAFEEPNHSRGGESNRGYDEGAAGRPTPDSRWAAYEPLPRSEQPRYEASPPPQPAPYNDGRTQASWPAPGYDTTNSDGRAQASRQTYIPPRFEGHGRSDPAQAGPDRPHVSFQEPGSSAERPEGRNG